MSGILSKSSEACSSTGNMSRGGGRAFLEELRRSAFQDDDTCPVPVSDGGGEPVVEEEDATLGIWETRILLSVLEDIFINNLSSSCPLPSTLIQAFQKFLLAVNSAVSKQNHFVESTGTGLGKQDSHLQKAPEDEFEVDADVMDELLSMTDEQRKKVQDMITLSVGNMWGKILGLFAPLLEAEEVANSEKGGGGVEGAISSNLEGKEAILGYLKKQQVESAEMVGKVMELLKSREEEKKLLEKEIEERKELAKRMLEEEAAMHDPEFLKLYEKHNTLEKNVILEQMKLAELKLEEDKYPDDEEQEEMKDLYDRVRAEYIEMLEEVKEMEERAQKYRDLGPEYLSILKEYKEIEEQIKTKEWVKEQLTKAGSSSGGSIGGGDDSFLNDSV